MRVPHEQVTGHDRHPPTPETIATSYQKHSMQDSSSSRARGVTEETDPLTPTLSVQDVSDDRSSSRSESQISIGERLANLGISSPILARSLSPLLSPDYPLPSVEVAETTTIRGPITVRDLPNATPRPSPSPEPHTQAALRAFGDSIRAPIETVDDEPNGPATGGEFDIPGFEDLSLQENPILYEVLDEPLPPGPFSDRDYQNALKAAKTLTEDIFTNLSHCDWPARPGTQLNKIKQRAQALNRLDSPASRTIGIVGDSAAGKDN